MTLNSFYPFFLKVQSSSRRRVLHIVLDILMVHKGDFLELGYIVFRWRENTDSMRGCLGRPHRRVFAIRAQLGRHRISASLVVRRTHQVCIGRDDFRRAAHASVTSGGCWFPDACAGPKGSDSGLSIAGRESSGDSVWCILLLFVGSGCVRYGKSLC